MNRGDAKLLATILIAWSDGKPIQCLDINDTWIDLHSEEAPVNAWPTVYRIKPEPPAVEYIPLHPEDVPPGSVVRLHRGADKGGAPWIAVNYPGGDFIEIATKLEVRYEDAARNGWEINRSIPETGKWDPNAWQPCHKVKPTV